MGRSPMLIIHEIDTWTCPIQTQCGYVRYKAILCYKHFDKLTWDKSRIMSYIDRQTWPGYEMHFSPINMFHISVAPFPPGKY